eukprot:TRINITY_DN5479_c1_g1_i2.p1 TRINITY_DN5479_c1_g1~~TRINITY_DN5479_c1_g1_i2.p1  ORF type:complete len:104 (+),score=17.71 TRINITY_DN5479_c1_g1_i2:1024-1335(+)
MNESTLRAYNQEENPHVDLVDNVFCIRFDPRVRELLDFSILLRGLQRDMAERGHSLESIKASIEARKPDFDAYIGIFLHKPVMLSGAECWAPKKWEVVNSVCS